MAEAVYDEILEEYSKDAEVYCGRFLSRYTVRYRKNLFSGMCEPECTSPPQMPVMEDGDYLRAMELSGPMKRVIYRQMEKDLLGGRKAGEKEPEGNSQRQPGDTRNRKESGRGNSQGRSGERIRWGRNSRSGKRRIQRKRKTEKQGIDRKELSGDR